MSSQRYLDANESLQLTIEDLTELYAKLQNATKVVSELQGRICELNKKFDRSAADFINEGKVMLGED